MRSQKVLADGMILEEKLELPLNEVIKKEYSLAAGVISDGKLELRFEAITGPNPVVSAIELWSTSETLIDYLDVKVDSASIGMIKGLVTDSNSAAAAGVTIVARLAGKGLEISTTTDGHGAFTAEVPDSWLAFKKEQVSITAVKGKARGHAAIDMADFLPVAMPQLTPLPDTVGGLKSFTIDLNGTWRFHPTPQPGFWNPDAAVNDWANIEVPGEWVMQGFVAPLDKGVGYRRTVAVPADWEGRRVKVRFDGVYCGSTFWVNGEEIGWHDGGFSPIEYDITDFIEPGNENVLALSVINDSPAGILSNQSEYAAHPNGGISRKATLFAVNELHISRYHIETHFDDHYQDATMKILLNVSNQGPEPVSDAALRFRMTGPDGNWVRLEPRRLNLPEIPAGETLDHIVEIPVPAPRKWDAEHPNLYTLSCTLREDRRRLETVSRRIGFRQVEVRGQQVFVNGNPIKLRGICRHEAHPLRGRSLRPGLWRQDAELFRQANMNYIRTSHYPPAEEFIDACDELGLFVELEAPFCFAGLGAVDNPVHRSPPGMVDDPQYQAVHVQVTLEMIERDRSHPSVIIWSIGNESKWGANFIAAGKASKKADPTRPVLISAWGADHDGGMLDLGGSHYAGYGGPSQYADYPRPVMYDEYCHLNCYNHTENLTDPGLRDYWGSVLAPQWEGMYASKSCVGGAIWSAIDDAFLLPRGMTTPYVGYGKWGPLDGWRRQKPEYWHIKKTYSPVRIFQKTTDVPAVGEPIQVEVENRYDFRNLNEVKAVWALGEETGTATIEAPPRQKGVLAIKPARKDLAGNKLVLTFYDPAGYLVDTYRLPIGDEPRDNASDRAMGKPRLQDSGNMLTIESGNAKWVIDKTTGMISEGRCSGRTVVTGGPVLMANPLIREADVPLPNKQWPEGPSNVRCSNWKLGQIEVLEEADACIVKVAGHYDQAAGVYLLRFDVAGNLTVDYAFKFQTEVNPREIGILFDVARECDRLSWKRKGLWTAYPQDHIGRTQGEARAFRDTFWPVIDERTPPPWPWSLDSTPGGTNDFRSSKFNIYWAMLRDPAGHGVKVVSDGRQTTRSYVDSDRIGFFVAYYSIGGTEHYFPGDPPGVSRISLKKGSKVADSVQVQLVRVNDG